MAAPLVVLSAASSAAKSPTLRRVAGAVIAAPVLIVVLLVLLLTADLAAQAANDGVGAPSALRSGTVPAAYEGLVVRAAQTCPGITAPLLAAQLEAESGWNPQATSPVGAQGLAQFMPATWAGEGIDGDGDGRRDPFTPAARSPARPRSCASCSRPSAATSG